MLILSVSIFAISLSSVLAEKIGNIEMDFSKDLEVVYRGVELDQYVFNRREDKSLLLMLTNWPPPNVEADFPQLLKGLAEGFLDFTKKDDEVAVVDSKFEEKDFSGDNFTGKLVTMNLEDKTTVIYFFIKGNGKIWNGLFHGSKEEWKLLTDKFVKLRWVN